MVMSRLMLVGVVAILLALGALTVNALIGANARVTGSRVSFTEQRLIDAEKGSFDRHDANVMRNVRAKSASGATEPDRHDRNVMRYVRANRGNGVAALDRHDRNVMRYIQTSTK